MRDRSPRVGAPHGVGCDRGFLKLGGPEPPNTPWTNWSGVGTDVVKRFLPAGIGRGLGRGRTRSRVLSFDDAGVGTGCVRRSRTGATVGAIAGAGRRLVGRAQRQLLL